MLKRFFKNIFEKNINFVRNTAWLQPFLVASLMFFIIAMIPVTSTCFRNLFLMPSDVDVFYHRYEKSIQKVDKMFHEFTDFNNEENVNNVSVNKSKYFILFLDKKNPIAKSYAKSLYEVIGSRGADGKKIILYTVYIDKDKKKFKKLLNDNKLFFEDVLRATKNNDDFIKGLIGFKTIRSIVDPDTFSPPIMLLIDLNKKKEERISVYFDIKGTDDFEKINFLYKCWNK